MVSTMRLRPTLAQLFIATVALLTAGLVVLFLLVLEGSSRNIVQASEQLRVAHARELRAEVERYLGLATSAVQQLEERLRLGLVSADDGAALERMFFGMLLDQPALLELTFTRATVTGFKDRGFPVVDPAGREQWAVFREDAGPTGRLWTRHVSRDSTTGPFRAEVRRRPAGGDFDSVPFSPDDGRPPDDPTTDPTFITPSRKRLQGQTLWSDLAWFKPDVRVDAVTGQLTGDAKVRVVVYVMCSVKDRQGRLAGVMRASLGTETLDRLVVQQRELGPHRRFLCDLKGRLISRLSSQDSMVTTTDDSLRFIPAHAPPEIIRSIAEVGRLHTVEGGPRSARLEVDGQPFLATLWPLSAGQEWAVGIVVAEAEYLGELQKTRVRLLRTALLVMALILIGGALTLRLVRRDLDLVVRATARIRDLDFAPSAVSALLKDVWLILDGMEQAKTALRAMGKYVPVALVRRLYRDRTEPTLGGVSQDLTVLFTDIKDFTSLAEVIPPDRLGRALGLYLEAMTGAIHTHEGVIDKYIGDAVMALFNAPSPVENHALKACRAALECVRRTDALQSGEQWEALPRFVTRFGIHSDHVLVGHFGAPDRMNYTALGDGVNLAARLEGLNKEYGTTILVSGSVRNDVGESLTFRLIDRVAVKGKSLPVSIYELIDPLNLDDRHRARLQRYEAAIALYFARDFAGALALVATAVDDPPSLALSRRCSDYMAEAPPPDWSGVHAFNTK